MRERSEGLRGVRGALGCLQRRAGKQEVAGAWPACGEHTLVLLSREEDDRGGASWAGPPKWWAGLATWAAGKAQVSLFYFCL